MFWTNENHYNVITYCSSIVKNNIKEIFPFFLCLLWCLLVLASLFFMRKLCFEAIIRGLSYLRVTTSHDKYSLDLKYKQPVESSRCLKIYKIMSHKISEKSKAKTFRTLAMANAKSSMCDLFPFMTWLDHMLHCTLQEQKVITKLPVLERVLEKQLWFCECHCWMITTAVFQEV